MLIRTTAINKILGLNKFVRAIKGGTSAGKTFGVIPVLIHTCAKHPLKEVSVVSESLPHLKRGAIRDFKKIMQVSGRWLASRWNATESRYTFKNGSFIEFFSADDDTKLRGARRDILYINECNNVTFNAYTELAMRTKECIYLDWNPVNEFWFNEEVENDDNVDFITLTYKDNEAAPESAVDFILRAKEKAKTSEYWANWYNVYGLGLQGSLEGVVFGNWKTIPSIPSEARLLGCGLDFGYSNDPTALIAVYKYNDTRILHEVLYKKGMVNQEIAPFIPKETVWADSAEPKSIEEIRRLNVDIRPVEKGRDSIMFGIQTMQTQEYLVTESSTSLIKELRNYCYDTDKNGKTLNKPIDDYNHAIDAVRYHEMMTLGIKKEMFFF